MPPKVQKCSLCRSLRSEKWYMLDRRWICSVCHDIQLNPPIEPLRERTPDRATSAGPSTSKNQSSSGARVGDPLDVDDPGEGTSKQTEPARGKKKHTVTFADPPETELTLAATDECSEEAKDTVTPLGTFSPRRLRRRICPVVKPTVRKRASSGKPGRRAYLKSKAKSRRSILKKPPTKSTTETAYTKSVQKVFHENLCYQVGDIVSMVDQKDNTYYAQINGLLIDIYREKSATLTWLIPTTCSPPPNEGFDASTYIIGPQEDMPRRLSYMQFVMNAPSNYYLDRHNPFPSPETYGPTNTSQRNNRNYVWANISHLHHGEHVPLPSGVV
uniref:Putative gata zinc finger domain-containing protein 1 n=1 Tax=Anopheles triannulatus TaxID=58253 RepID=A0A2M4AV54_9DIPT